MLFDQRGALPQVQQDILDAADYIREHGWTQGKLFAGEAVCIAGALIKVCGESGNDYEDIPRDSNAAIHFLSRRMGTYVVQWQDAPGRTKEEVIAWLERIGWEG